ncbi:hypothetical protein NDU88_000896 [Pleurodeles waltl]|uniref:Uncharacterized protein n=1 Tax=Pleurodeles waltl TaxID=8319 RepID=A0AAV7TGB5_PLEWA|nr:hypothetical protein NDU88_000896 [Pleurodeles waltl]
MANHPRWQSLNRGAPDQARQETTIRYNKGQRHCHRIDHGTGDAAENRGSGFQTPGEVLMLQKETEDNWARGVRRRTGCDAARIAATGRYKAGVIRRHDQKLEAGAEFGRIESRGPSSPPLPTSRLFQQYGAAGAKHK